MLKGRISGASGTLSQTSTATVCESPSRRRRISLETPFGCHCPSALAAACFSTALIALLTSSVPTESASSITPPAPQSRSVVLMNRRAGAAALGVAVMSKFAWNRRRSPRCGACCFGRTGLFGAFGRSFICFVHDDHDHPGLLGQPLHDGVLNEAVLGEVV